MLNVEVTRTGNENAVSLIRRFSRRVQGAGILRKAKERRYFARPLSKYSRKKHALKKLARRKTYLGLLKLGRVEERKPRR